MNIHLVPMRHLTTGQTTTCSWASHWRTDSCPSRWKPRHGQNNPENGMCTHEPFRNRITCCRIYIFLVQKHFSTCRVANKGNLLIGIYSRCTPLKYIMSPAGCRICINVILYSYCRCAVCVPEVLQLASRLILADRSKVSRTATPPALPVEVQYRRAFEPWSTL